MKEFLCLPVSGSLERAREIFFGYVQAVAEQDSLYEKIQSCTKLEKIATDFFIDKEEAFNELRTSEDLTARTIALQEASGAFEIAKIVRLLRHFFTACFFQENPEGAAHMSSLEPRGNRALYLLEKSDYSNEAFPENFTSKDLLTSAYQNLLS